MVRIKLFWILIILCLCIYGCGNEGIESALHSLSAPSAVNDVTGVPHLFYWI